MTVGASECIVCQHIFEHQVHYFDDVGNCYCKVCSRGKKKKICFTITESLVSDKVEVKQ